MYRNHLYSTYHVKYCHRPQRVIGALANVTRSIYICQSCSTEKHAQKDSVCGNDSDSLTCTSSAATGIRHREITVTPDIDPAAEDGHRGGDSIGNT